MSAQNQHPIYVALDREKSFNSLSYYISSCICQLQIGLYLHERCRFIMRVTCTTCEPRRLLCKPTSQRRRQSLFYKKVREQHLCCFRYFISVTAGSKDGEKPKIDISSRLSRTDVFVWTSQWERAQIYDS